MKGILRYKVFSIFLVLIVFVGLFLCKYIIDYKDLESLSKFYNSIGLIDLKELSLKLHAYFENLEEIDLVVSVFLISIIKNFFDLFIYKEKFKNYPFLLEDATLDLYKQIMISLSCLSIFFILLSQNFFNFNHWYFSIGIILFTIIPSIIVRDKKVHKRIQEIEESDYTIVEEEVHNKVTKTFDEYILSSFVLFVILIFTAISPVITLINNLDQLNRIRPNVISVTSEQLCNKFCYVDSISNQYKMESLQFTVEDVGTRQLFEDENFYMIFFIDLHTYSIKKSNFEVSMNNGAYIYTINLEDFLEDKKYDYVSSIYIEDSIFGEELPPFTIKLIKR